MAVIPSLRSRAKTTTRFPYIDDLFDYGKFLEQAPGAIGKLADPGQAIAVVGSGIAGLVTAYELMRAGATNIDIYEAGDRIGGRAYSAQFGDGGSTFLAELGAMRFPPSEFGLFSYLNRFGISYSDNFPDPGKVDTNIGYQGQSYNWPADGSPPAIFDTVNTGWDAFVNQGWQEPGGTTFTAPVQITALLKEGKLEQAKIAWQQYLTHFENKSFYNGLVEMFTSSTAPGGKQWTYPDDFELFGALGLGSGGFGPLYAIGFVELLRLIVNELETDQKFVPGGIESLARAFSQQVIGGVQLGSKIKLNSAITAVEFDGKQVFLTVAGAPRKAYARVVLAATNRAMEIDMGISSNLNLLNKNQYSALNEVHMTSSSKVFVLTKDKFWLKQSGLPANIQTDTLVRGVYCLDYTPGRPDDPGVVLLSYTWEDDSIKQMGIQGNAARVKRLVADVAQTNRAFAEYIVPVNEDYESNVHVIDWDSQAHYYGAFKLNFPGDDGLTSELFYQYLSCLQPDTDKFVYLAGDSFSYTGGWIEGAVQTGVNAACAVIKSLGGDFYTLDNPISAQKSSAYNYEAL